ncbi:cytochrome d ubiquinol oxidase subunit II [Oceanobacter sp. 4_MG-2023]|jgi:cytochrome d ubiquinol oxidase subunit II|nr:MULTISPECIES: cytochrome d ubiquinol oxidase subunit II [unclassified Oceanobacter]MDO6681921.1 cytochrome d ubiquinol oxidase subunit II [Oceanobacter sp. 5_MG-2023]MDP2505283.1 cytochrome d ubiquinol oxidase subunit II [Oceanobacter sp. 3_MG-2023]MDP2547957.1 cytochrome d ubiquinol oxidase subunit II [Oceanobacter sp. 4_MG-2023]MDP2609886.1 cytochrome d ubiquinol oxidase subunit II [Oceanobacter sp. 1_MG-2023]MDP2612236.1 cytochrome d ubiquinol oxidase subunit II [Oceanobacter sp. 2_MG-20
MDYEVLKLVWWVLIGVLLVGFAVTDGFDMGVGALLRIIGRTDTERRVMLNTIGPHWDGNQVWFITAGGAIFAAWPVVYAVAFSGFYWAMLLVLFAMFFRPVGFEYRAKVDDPRWRSLWDWGLTIGGAVPALVFGVAFGNLILGVPFSLDEFMRSTYTGSFWALLNPFGLVAGLVSLGMLMMHGGTWLQMRTDGALHERARRITVALAVLVAALFALAGVWIWMGIDGYVIMDIKSTAAAVTPLDKVVTTQEGAWLSNYGQHPWMMIAPLLGFAGLALTVLMSMMNRGVMAFVSSSLAITGIILTAGFSLFPFIMPSSLEPSHSLTVWDVVSSEMTLNIMFWVAMVFVPIVLSYTIWGYYKMWGRLTNQFIEDNKYSTY